MIHLLVDTSVLIKWFHEAGEAEVAPARAIRDAHMRGDLQAHVLDLGIYELGNVLARALRWSAADVADQLDDVIALTGAPISITATALRSAAELAVTRRLTFYDASWAASAVVFSATLVSADRQLLTAGLAESPTALAHRLRL